MANEKDIKAIAKLKEKLNPKREVSVPISVLEDVCDYCEYMGLYNKDFYCKIKQLLQ